MSAPNVTAPSPTLTSRSPITTAMASVEGVQTEVQHLLDKLSTLLPPATYQANADQLRRGWPGQDVLEAFTNMPAKFLNAAYNWQFVAMDGSLGVHNAPFAVGLLKASIGDLTGDANNDGLPDSWQISYFGSGFATNAAAAPNAINNTDGMPNWMMYALGLDPFSGSTAVQRRDLCQRQQHRQRRDQHHRHLHGGGNRLRHAGGNDLYHSGHHRPHRQLVRTSAPTSPAPAAPSAT